MLTIPLCTAVSFSETIQRFVFITNMGSCSCEEAETTAQNNLILKIFSAFIVLTVVRK